VRGSRLERFGAEIPAKAGFFWTPSENETSSDNVARRADAAAPGNSTWDPSELTRTGVNCAGIGEANAGKNAELCFLFACLPLPFPAAFCAGCSV